MSEIQLCSTDGILSRGKTEDAVENMSPFKGKVTSVPLQTWSGPEGSKKLRFPDFMITAQEGGKVVSLTHRPLFTPQEILLVLISGRG